MEDPQRAAFDALVEGWLSALASDNTRDAYRRDLQVFETWCAAEDQAPLKADRGEIDRYRDACGDRGAGPATIARRLSALSSFYAHAVAAHAVGCNPLEQVARPAPVAGPQPTLDEADALALVDAAVADGPKVTVLVALLLVEGMKLGETLALDADHVTGSGWAMRATVARRGQPQAVVLDGRTATAIAHYLAGRTTGPLLLGDSPTQPDGARLTRFGADFLIKRVAARAGVAGSVSANTLRRSYINLSHREGKAVESIRRHVGHSSIRETRRYIDGYTR
jgi:site-specific recombinase XerD